ncbi:MAG: DEAD/DEAH box helicase [Phycisphaerales bacterium]
MQKFDSLDLPKPILSALSELGYDTPTPIQAKSIPPALQGDDVLGSAQTGTGKSAAFAIPTLSRLFKSKPGKGSRGPIKPRALVLSPTRELASQIQESFTKYGRHTGLRQTAIFGGVNQFHQVRALRKGVDVIVATPGRLMDLMQQGFVDLTSIEVFILDEADRMLDMGFIDPIRKIASKVPTDRQTLLFSATMPKEIEQLANSLLSDPVRIAVDPVASAAPKIDQSLFFVQRAQKPALMLHLLDNDEVERAIVFTRTKRGADKLARSLEHGNVRCSTIHGNKSQNQRKQALAMFRSGKSRVLVATDVAARGLDVDGITHSFNYDIPVEPEAYVHRIGRTGRAGRAGVAISLCDKGERPLLRAIERLTGDRIQACELPADLPVIEPTRQHSEQSSGKEHSRSREVGKPRPAKNGRVRSRRAKSDTSETAKSTQATKRPRKAAKPAGKGGDTAHSGRSGKPKAKPGSKRQSRDERSGRPPAGKSASASRNPRKKKMKRKVAPKSAG